MAYPSMNTPDPYHSGKHLSWPSPPLGPGDIDNTAQYQLPASSHPNSAYPDTPTPPLWQPQSSAMLLYQPSLTSGDMYNQDASSSWAACTPPTPLHSLPSESTALVPALGGQMYSPTGSSDLSTQPSQPPYGPSSAIHVHHGPEMGGADRAHEGYLTHHFGMPATPESLSTASKSDEPYAKLIFRALMSRPDHRMTLQEIYQWFRDNTTKADGDKDKKGGGWQNSIRHNLSMNKAFVKPDPKEESADSKRSNVWVLEDWATTQGVLSTTRYRNELARRPARRSASQQHDGDSRPGPYSAIRSQSGRRGGCATRSARLRQQLYHQQSLASEMPHYPTMYSHATSPPGSDVYSNALADGLMSSGAMAQVKSEPTSYGYGSPGFDLDPGDLYSYMSDPSMGHYVPVGGEVGSLQTRFNAAPAVSSTPAMYFGTHLNYTGSGEGADNQYSNRQSHAKYESQGQLVADTAANATDGDICGW